jgi:hypothetical protein
MVADSATSRLLFITLSPQRVCHSLLDWRRRLALFGAVAPGRACSFGSFGFRICLGFRASDFGFPGLGRPNELALFSGPTLLFRPETARLALFCAPGALVPGRLPRRLALFDAIGSRLLRPGLALFCTIAFAGSSHLALAARNELRGPSPILIFGPKTKKLGLFCAVRRRIAGLLPLHSQSSIMRLPVCHRIAILVVL